MPKYTATIVLVSAMLVATSCGQKPEPPAPPPAAEPTPAPAAEPTPAPAPTSAPAPAPAPVTAAPVPLPESGATLAGTVTGPVPTATPDSINMATDTYCVNAHDAAVFPQTAVINNAGQVQWAFVYVKSGLEGYEIPQAEDAVVMDQHGCMYSPHVFGVQSNQPIEIHNSDQTLHNVHAIPHAPNKRFNIAHPNIPGMVHRKSFANPDVMVHFKCDVHPWMSAYVGVLPHSFFAVTDAAGRYAIPNLPPGDYTIGVWHESLGEQEHRVSIPAEGEAALDVTFAGA